MHVSENIEIDWRSKRSHSQVMKIEIRDIYMYNRGGASEASIATLTGDVDGSSRYMYV